MSNEEIDRICCEFAGLEQIKKYGPDHMISLLHASNLRNPEHTQKIQADREARVYPAISTDATAMVQLMEALGHRGIIATVKRFATSEMKPWFGTVSGDGWGYLEHRADTPMMALAMAVADLAEGATK